ncbi:retinitis pigmentosa 1-like 1 protein [Engraulis encrasicolus]|uniref:retinitis pigmentosa 1-like 1 protein n=1 Tax=Engraulis encrasicolus TaxID=184585 RepID=UPI002FD3C585
MDGQSSLELVQSCLPNASPTDVVHEWLKNIPVDGPVYQMEDETDTEGPQRTDSVERLEDSIQNDSDELEDEQHSKTEENEEENIDPCEEKEDATEETIEAKDDTSAGEGDINNISDDAATQAEEGKIEETKIDGFPKRAHSSVQVMKALLSPKLDRCNSLPEVSPAYGRKLSRSAEGLLDCLAKLRLIDLDPANNPNPKYTEIMTILQTLWLYNPAEWDSKSSRVKDDPSAEDDANPRSSSGVDVSSGSADTPKSMTNNGAENVESSAENKLDEQEAEAENEEVVSNADTPDVAARVQGSQEISEKNNEADTGNEATQSGETHKETTEEPSESPNTSSGKESRSANDSERPEGSSSGTPPSTKQAQLTSRVSLEPDPTWVLSLLKKIEKQFMSHYASAMQEFKVRWNLDDNAMLDTMINELKVEVQNRIQSSIKRELQKIQGRAGKSPRPPSSNLSKDSVVTDQRRRRLKVMRDRSLKVSNSNGSDAASGTSFSDQRSDDEYCPCDACVRKKMEAKQVIRAEVLNTAPVRMEFDLRKILQIKKAPPPPPKVEPPPPAPTQPESVPSEEKQQDSNLDVVEEEPEQEEEEEAQEEADAEAEAEEGTAGGEDVEAEEEEQAGEDADEGETASVVHDDGGQEEEDGGAEDEDAQDEVADEEGDDATDQQQSKDETEDNAIAEKTPMDDTEGDVNQVDSTEAADEIQEELEEAEEEEEDGGEGDTAVQNDNEAEENEEAQDQEEIEDGGEEEEETTVVADSKAPKGKSWEQFRHRQMTRTSVESQTGSMDSMELQLEAKQIVQSVFTNIQGGPKRDWDETGSSSSSKKRSRSPAARANKPRRPKDSDIKVDDDLEY